MRINRCKIPFCQGELRYRKRNLFHNIGIFLSNFLNQYLQLEVIFILRAEVSIGHPFGLSFLDSRLLTARELRITDIDKKMSTDALKGP